MAQQTMHSLIKHILLCVFLTMFAQVRAAVPTPSQQDCNLLIATVASAAIWRDNKVPIQTAQSNVRAVLDQMPATPEDKSQWAASVSAIYSSRVTSAQVQDALRPTCASKQK